jgi:pimeloyl-ACP methyl ester carboxylesterase
MHLFKTTSLIAPRRTLLVGHSLAGLHISMAAARAPERIDTLIYLDALLPQPGDSFQSLFCDHLQERTTWNAFLSQLHRNERGVWGPHNGAMLDDLDDVQVSDFLARLTPQPLGTLTERLGDAPIPRYLRRVYVACTRTHLSLAREQVAHAATRGVDVVPFDAGHDPLWTRPRQLAQLLDSIASS